MLIGSLSKSAATSGREQAGSKVARTWFSSLRLVNPQRIEPQSYRPTLRYAATSYS